MSLGKRSYRREVIPGGLPYANQPGISSNLNMRDPDDYFMNNIRTTCSLSGRLGRIIA